MHHAFPTIGSISREILDNFTKKTLKDGSQFWDFREDIEWQHHIVMDAYGHRMLCPEAYNTIFKILMEVYIADNSEQAEDFLVDIEPHATTSQLTGWLHSASENVEYLSRAMAVVTSNDGTEALAMAHKLFLQEVGASLIQAIKRYIGENALLENSLN